VHIQADFLYLGYVDVQTISLWRGFKRSRSGQYGFLLPKPFRWYSALQNLELVGMFYAQRAIAVKIYSLY
jgi:hypothetical protein